MCILSRRFSEWANIYSERILWRNPESFSRLWLLQHSPRCHFLPLCQIQATLPGCCTCKEEEASHLCTLPQNMVDNTDSPMIWPLLVSRQQEDKTSVITIPKSTLCSFFSVCLCAMRREKEQHRPDSPSEVPPLQAGSSQRGKCPLTIENPLQNFKNCCWFPRNRNQRPPLFVYTEPVVF